MLDSFSLTQASYLTAISANKMTIGPDVIDYLDVFHCEDIGGEWECYNYQPDWGDNETDGYPRLGRKEVVRYTDHR